MSWTPCIADDALLYAPRWRRKIVDFDEDERPVALQILTCDVDRMLEAVEKVLPLAPDVIDVNMGCPARRVVSSGRGAALLKDPDHAAELVAALAAEVEIPVTAKIRLGWDDESRNYLEVARRLEGAGAAAIAVHGRTRAQGYSGRADWDAIAEVRQAVTVPVLANGDVGTVADVARIKQVTGCPGVLVGRKALGNPWIFAGRDQGDVPYAERLAVIARHLEAMVDYYGPQQGVVLFRKHVTKYIRGLDDATRLRPRLVRAETQDEVLAILRSWRQA